MKPARYISVAFLLGLLVGRWTASRPPEYGIESSATGVNKNASEDGTSQLFGEDALLEKIAALESGKELPIGTTVQDVDKQMQKWGFHSESRYYDGNIEMRLAGSASTLWFNNQTPTEISITYAPNYEPPPDERKTIILNWTDAAFAAVFADWPEAGQWYRKAVESLPNGTGVFLEREGLEVRGYDRGNSLTFVIRRKLPKLKEKE